MADPLKSFDHSLRERALRAGLDVVSHGVIVQTVDGDILEVNRAAERVLGLSRAQIEGHAPLPQRWRAWFGGGEPFPADRHPVAVALHAGMSAADVVVNLEDTLGARSAVRVKTAPISLASDQATFAWVGTFEDVSVPVETTRELAAAREQLAHVFDGSNDGFWDYDARSDTFDRSPRLREILGYVPGVDEYRPVSMAVLLEMIHPEDRERAATAVNMGLLGETGRYVAEYRIRRKDQTWVWVLSRGKVVARGSNGEPLRAAGTFTDITERRTADEALRAALAKNEQLVAHLQRALHEVKTLSGLLPICMFCKSVRTDDGYWARIESYLQDRTDVLLSHGLCPECEPKFLDGVSAEVRSNVK